MTRSIRGFAAWLAVLAFSLNALWPLVAHAKPKQSGPLVPICSIDGVTHFYELPPVDAPIEKRPSAHHDHCAFCFTGAERVAVALVAALLFEMPEPAAERIALVAVSPAVSPDHPPAQPRGPPSRS